MQSMTSCLMYCESKFFNSSRTCFGGPPGASVSVRLWFFTRLSCCCWRSALRLALLPLLLDLLPRLARTSSGWRDGERLAADRLESDGDGPDLDGGHGVLLGRAGGRDGGGGGGINSFNVEGGGTAWKLSRELGLVCGAPWSLPLDRAP